MFTAYCKCKVHRVRHEFMHWLVQPLKYPHSLHICAVSQFCIVSYSFTVFRLHGMSGNLSLWTKDAITFESDSSRMPASLEWKANFGRNTFAEPRGTFGKVLYICLWHKPWKDWRDCCSIVVPFRKLLETVLYNNVQDCQTVKTWRTKQVAENT